jgi:uncharacterized membrane protein YciS (DUF1049 family)
MNVIKKIVFTLIFCLCLAYGVLFALQNDQMITLDPLVFSSVEHSAAAVVIFAFCAGGLLGMLFTISVYFRTRGQALSTSMKLRKAEKELAKFRGPQ